MTDSATPLIREFAERLLAREAASSERTEASVPPAFLVCEKLRYPLSTFAGAAGFHSLISRALTLAKREVPSLGSVEVKADGSLKDSDRESMLSKPDAAGGVLLVAYLLGLLFSVIGKTLTLHLIRHEYPNAYFNELSAEGTGAHEPQG